MASITFTTAGAINATSFNATSTREKKENIIDANLNAIDFLKDVNVVNYTFKEDNDHVPHIGFIAEDTDSLLSTPGKNQMDVGNCIGVLIKAVQELTTKVESLEKELDDIKKLHKIQSAL